MIGMVAKTRFTGSRLGRAAMTMLAGVPAGAVAVMHRHDLAVPGDYVLAVVAVVTGLWMGSSEYVPEAEAKGDPETN